MIRQRPVELSRALKTLQQRVTRARNVRDSVFGPLWQGRFKAKRVEDPGYLRQLIGYVHLNPVKAGLVERPEQYRWSGHREILGQRRNPIVATDAALLAYGETRRRALALYRSALQEMADQDWSEAEPGRLPWWKLGRPTEEDRLVRQLATHDETGRPTARWRPSYSAEEWVELACAHLGVGRALAAAAGDSRRWSGPGRSSGWSEWSSIASG